MTASKNKKAFYTKSMEQFKLNLDHLLTLTTKAAVLSRKTERGELLTEMLNIINEERKGTKYKPLSIKLLGIKLGHIPTKDLYYTLSVGKDYKKRNGSFSKYLFGVIKVK